jgi:hypothetical protein
MKNSIKCSGWCPPVVIYIVLAVSSTIISLFATSRYDDMNNQGVNKVLYSIIHLSGISIWTWVLYWLCSNCYKTTAWVVLLFPLLLFVALLIIALASGVFKKTVPIVSLQHTSLKNINNEYHRSKRLYI